MLFFVSDSNSFATTRKLWPFISTLGVLVAIRRWYDAKKRVDCGTVSCYTCRRPVLKLKSTTLHPYVSVLA